MTAMALTADRLVLFAAKKITRRRLFRRASGAALTASYGVAFFGRTEMAWANYTACNATGAKVALCSSTRCYTSGNTTLCHNSLQTKPGGYNKFDCFYSSSGSQCWLEQYGCTWTCCDCCVDYNTGSGTCLHCSSLMWGCICRASRC